MHLAANLSSQRLMVGTQPKYLTSYLLTLWLGVLIAAQILDFLSNVAADPATYGAPVARKTDFQLLYNSISALL